MLKASCLSTGLIACSCTTMCLCILTTTQLVAPRMTMVIDDPRDTSFLNSFQRDPSAMKNRISAGFMNEPDQRKPSSSTNQQPDDTFVAPPLPPPLPVINSSVPTQPATRTNYQSYDVIDTNRSTSKSGI